MVDLSNAGNAHVLIVDDEPDIRDLIAITLQRMGLRTLHAGGRREAEAAILNERPDLCLTDMRMADGNGLDLVGWIQEHVPGMPVAVITAHGNVESAVNALKLGAFDFVSKPVDVNDLRRLVSAALNMGKAEKETAADASRPQLLGDSAAIHRVREMIAKVARSQAPVHISGESGTGKELAARLIHDSGPRAGQAFVPVNCGAIPSELMESEFFGHRKGSFTGAHADKEGLFHVADGGTLFLDEVADLPLHMQVKLLRVIQEKCIRPVGAAREIPVNVRVLSATHRDLAKDVSEGKFREDLFYRINVIELHLPSLRERRSDIPSLVDSLLGRMANNLGISKPFIEPDAMGRLLEHDYPGNVRELENVLERAVTLSGGDVIHAGDIQIRRSNEPRLTTPARRKDDLEIDALPRQLGEPEKQAISDALEKTRYNKTKAAKLLGLTLRQLRYRIQKLGLEE
ncbi:MAG TPA: sigma-54 dependent transcriptional regulator [Gammaproteobacteria bacterium]